MHRPTLNELPPPPPARTGWPWTEESSQLPDTMSDGSPWPRVSIVTPSYNQGQFIEETFRSVLLQDYPNLEYIVTDGGSTDGSVEVIRDYERWLAYWVSEKDQGQSHAINKGFTRATGDFWAWLNSDDIYLPNTVSTAMYHLQEHPEWAIVYGSCEIIDSDGIIVGQFTGREFDLHRMLRTWSPPIPQPGSFFRRVALQDVGLLDETLHWGMDLDLWARLGVRYRLGFVPNLKAHYRVHPGAKADRSTPEHFFDDWRVVCDKLRSDDSVPREIRNAATKQVIPYARRAIQLHKEGHIREARSLLASTVLRYPWKIPRGYWTPMAQVMLSGSVFGIFANVRRLLHWLGGQ